MTPYEQAEAKALSLGMNFHKVLMEHFGPNSYVYSSPDCFIMAVDASLPEGEFGEALFITLAVGRLAEFVAVDPLRDRRKWIGCCREEGGEVHWVPADRLNACSIAVHHSQN